jgi:hypothetical protein
MRRRLRYWRNYLFTGTFTWPLRWMNLGDPASQYTFGMGKLWPRLSPIIWRYDDPRMRAYMGGRYRVSYLPRMGKPSSHAGKDVFLCDTLLELRCWLIEHDYLRG